ncbi:MULTISPECIES: histidinol dehydrogenase [unclassified Fusibacter]|uniref:histidinol dehydrogenase n=1 Tax=unclassified Fusibacter TaxID=2624464 RepID=UPI0010129026|nr:MULTISPECIES: histidinol dehydrogenase [unclassified Fusibacter]MCK8058845.1 histidinol dehydrogenase [Fusibacter sp. A2]NPE21919.1 histidinol dehydrogenase [Fusibacter sp. A1]RXV61489.1 histidinol dehydrogenase [Fusibacter sp. A1]
MNEKIALYSQVREIINTVIDCGDQSLFDYAVKFDKVALERLKVTKEELKSSFESCDMEILNALRVTERNIRTFAQLQLPKEPIVWKDKSKTITLKQTPIERVGVYVPGGLAAYPSSVLMNVIPAQVAGVKEIALFTPPTSNLEQKKLILSCAELLGIDEIYFIGGVQAIAACAYGTETIRKVDLITGPGNKYVTEAKKQVFGDVGIDMLAGPSELMVVADETSNPSYVASDLLAQAEHDPNAVLHLILIASDGKRIKSAIGDQLLIDNNSCAAISMDNLTITNCESLAEAIELANRLAPEHLSIQISLKKDELARFSNAGSIFYGSQSPEAIGDYASGSNHILPTSGTARFSSCFGVHTFLKGSQVIHYHEYSEKDYQASMILAECERLPYHKKSLEIRGRCYEIER